MVIKTLSELKGENECAQVKYILLVPHLTNILYIYDKLLLSRRL